MAQKIINLKRGPDDEIVLSFTPPKVEFTVSAKEHLKSASKETLLAFRSLLDEAISAIEKKEGKKPQ